MRVRDIRAKMQDAKVMALDSKTPSSYNAAVPARDSQCFGIPIQVIRTQAREAIFSNIHRSRRAINETLHLVTLEV